MRHLVMPPNLITLPFQFNQREIHTSCVLFVIRVLILCPRERIEVMRCTDAKDTILPNPVIGLNPIAIAVRRAIQRNRAQPVVQHRARIQAELESAAPLAILRLVPLRYGDPQPRTRLVSSSPRQPTALSALPRCFEHGVQPKLDVEDVVAQIVAQRPGKLGQRLLRQPLLPVMAPEVSRRGDGQWTRMGRECVARWVDRRKRMAQQREQGA
mmetsp:Transcript_34450/g.80683  ORF Transcript_34450/g.80683 Transcript_34450/m.80683 type:complete len:212 (+) Transcript_34450:324-959(+)